MPLEVGGFGSGKHVDVELAVERVVGKQVDVWLVAERVVRDE